MDKFLKEYHGHRFQDDGPYCSDDFKSFARKFKSYLKRNLPAGCEIVAHSCGHYDLSGFVRKGEKHAYYSFSWDRFSPVDVNEESGTRSTVLYRTVRDARDFRGGINRFTSVAKAPEAIGSVLE